MSFTTPLALLLLATIPYFFWLGRPRVPIRRWRAWSSLGLRLLIIMLLTLSLAGTQMVRAADELAVVFLIDASDSMNAAQAAAAETFVRDAITTMTTTDQAAVIVFGANALVERPMSGLAELAPVTSAPQSLHTNLAEAIRLGMALFPAGSARRMVILSDGATTLGDTTAAAQLAAASSVQLDFYYLPRQDGAAEALLTSVNAPTRVVQGETFRLEVTAESTANMPANLRVLAGGQIVYEATVALRTGANQFTIPLRAAAQEFARYQVQLLPTADTYYQNNELSAFTEIVGPPRILLVASDGTVADDGSPMPDEAPQLRLALAAAGLEVDQTTPANLPANLAALSNYASIVLVNVNAKDLSPRKMEALQLYVRDLGGGLVAVGGPASYGMGGYFRTPLEETLPVEMQIKDQERFPSVSIVIVIDRSGSMGAMEGGVTKIQLAAEGAVRVVELLNDFDEITVIPVDTQPNNPIGPLPAGDKATAVGLIRQISAGGGGIYVRNGLEAAAAALANSPNQVKHIILLADGADSEQKDGVPELIAGLTAENVTITTVSIGQGPDTAWLQQMAELGNGRFHFTDQAANLPQIFTQETTSIQRSYLVEERFFPILGSSSPVLTGITAVPPLYGYVGTSAKGTAQVILKTHLDDPLLAAWQYGLGRAVAWTSDATGRWGIDWVRWNGFPVFWAQVVRWTVAQGVNSQVETTVTLQQGHATLMVNARGSDNTFLNNLVMESNVIAPDGVVTNLNLVQVAPGQYTTSFTPQAEGAYLIRVAGRDDEVVVAQTSGWVLGYSPEYQQLESNPALLAALAELTGGRDLSATDGGVTAVFDHTLPGQTATRPIWPWLTGMALMLLPLDVATRRLALTRRDWQRAWAATFGRWRPLAAPSTTTRPEQVSRLFQAKERAGTQRPANPATPLSPDTTSLGEPAPTGPTPSPAPSSAPAQAPPKAVKPPTPAGTPPVSGTLAARLLAKKRDQADDV